MNSKTYLTGLSLAIILLLVSFVDLQAQAQFKALVFSKTKGFRHQSIPDGVVALKKLARDHQFSVYATEDADIFTDEKLKEYDVIILMSTTGTIFNEDQKAAFQRFVQSGKGVVGIHSATDTEYEWPWYTKLIGAQFMNHPYIQSVRLNVVDRKHPATYHLPEKWLWTDELYAFKNFNENVRVLITADETSYDTNFSWKPTEGMGDFHPMAWTHEYDGGRIFYTALGHTDWSFLNENFLQHIYGGIWYAAKGFPIEE
ncbi:ThuA domain-containing protein [Arthrospiribacter ruber]|uniref:ThuA domain-containing protein n=1 Tax=Arthrospiribacter ruber TaxID=2487934 RepID=A0A951MC53_9BACT|nr:ThuA domain-containing protein [Arthrospiribacter ruber]MBW3469016.1 ThuA domain-containing protein [Arthrospiribacter ruber]